MFKVAICDLEAEARREGPFPPEHIERAIFLIRGQRILLDADLALIYRVPTKVLNQAVKRNVRKFPSDFVFRLSAQELDAIRTQITNGSNRSQIVTGSQKHRDPRFLPYAFTQHGAIMAANVLNSRRAVQMSVFVVRAFVKMRGVLTDTRDLARSLSKGARPEPRCCLFTQREL